MTRIEIVQSSLYRQMCGLGNDVLCGILQRHIDDTTTPFAGWDVRKMTIENGSINSIVAAGDIVFPTTVNKVVTGAIQQAVYYLRD